MMPTSEFITPTSAFLAATSAISILGFGIEARGRSPVHPVCAETADAGPAMAPGAGQAAVAVDVHLNDPVALDRRNVMPLLGRLRCEVDWAEQPGYVVTHFFT